MKKTDQLPYQITVAWSPRNEAYEARVPALKGVLAYGDTPEKAVKEVKIAASLWIEAVKASGQPIPASDIALEKLATMAPVLNLSAVARAADLKQTTLATKLKRGTALTEDEGRRVARVLQAHGVQL